MSRYRLVAEESTNIPGRTVYSCEERVLLQWVYVSGSVTFNKEEAEKKFRRLVDTGSVYPAKEILKEV